MGHNQSTENSRARDLPPEALQHSVGNTHHTLSSSFHNTRPSQPSSSHEAMEEFEGGTAPVPLIVVPDEEPSQDSAATPTDPLSLNPDFMTLKKFVEDSKTSKSEKISNHQLIMVLNAMARVYVKFPTSEVALDTALRALPFCINSLPSQPPPVLTELHMNALETFSLYDFKTNPSLIIPAFHFFVLLWGLYSSSLPASCNIKQLAQFIITALSPELGSSSRMEDAIACGRDFVFCLMQALSKSQLIALEKEGVFKSLRSLVVNYDKMALEDLKQIITGVKSFAELKPCAMVFLEENCYLWFILSALKYPSDEALQSLIWPLFSALCKSEKNFTDGLFDVGILDSVLSLLQMEGTNFGHPLKFLQVCCQVSPVVFITGCIDNRPFILYLLEILQNFISVGDGDPGPRVIFSCDFLMTLCGQSMPTTLTDILDLKIVSYLEDCARARPDIFLLQACIAIEGVINSFTMNVSFALKKVEIFTTQQEFYDQDHLLFFKDMLSNPVVTSNEKFIKLMYITFQKLLKAYTASVEGSEKIHSKEFLEFYSLCFIRDTLAFPNLVTRIVFTTHYFIFEMRTKEPISLLNDFGFHTTVANLLQSCANMENISTTMGLLACIVGKYYEFLKNVKPFLEAKVLDMILDKAMVCGEPGRRVQFSEDFGRIMLNVTADKELSQCLFENGYLNRLVETIEDKSVIDVRRTMIHAIGNIALGGQDIKQVLLDKRVYEILLSILRTEARKNEQHLLCACCRVLHILASGDWAKRKFVECGCIGILLEIMRVHKDIPEIRWRPLGLLSSLGFMAVTNRRYILTEEVMEVVTAILKESTNGKVISYTTLVFLGSDELDQGAKKLRELNVVEHLQKAIDNPAYRKQAPDLERWGIHVLEKQNLYTISIPRDSRFPVPPPPPLHPSDWPPYIPISSTGAPDTMSPHPKLLPLDDASFKSFTPIAPQLDEAAKQQLAKLGLDLNKPLFRIGRVYGSTHGLCSNCDKECTSEELVIRPLSMTVEQYQDLIDNGWYRRGGVKLFRLRHNHNMDCCDWETRVLANKFNHTSHKSYKKVLKRMPANRITVETVPAQFNREAFDLYNQYHIKKHDKPLKSEYSYCEHIVNTPTSHQTVNGTEYGTFHQMYRMDGKLVAVGIIDIVPKGMVSIYMWYDVTREISRYSFGVYSALKEIELVKEMSKKNPKMKYYYLQGWNGNNKKLMYKANYEPEEFYCPCIVPDWVSSLDGVNSAKEKVRVATNKERMVVDQPLQEGENKNITDGQDKAETKVSDCPVVNDKDVSSEDDNKPQLIECEALSMDKVRYQQYAGQTGVDISKIVICLNYTDYFYLEELFQRYMIDSNQLNIIESRFRELVVALSPELRSQLVIDMMASELASEPAPVDGIC